MVKRLAGLLAVGRLLLSAADQLITARIGTRPVGYLASQFGAAVRDAYRRGRHGPPSDRCDVAVIVIEGEIVE